MPAWKSMACGGRFRRTSTFTCTMYVLAISDVLVTLGLHTLVSDNGILVIRRNHTMG